MLYDGEGVFDLVTVGGDKYAGDDGEGKFAVILDWQQMTDDLKALLDNPVRVRVTIQVLDESQP